MSENQTEVKPKKKKGGYMPGGGRPKGSKSKTTIQREEALELAKDIIAGRTRKLIDIQTILAMGAIKVFKSCSHYVGTGKNARKITEKPVVVTDDDEIINAIDHYFHEGESPNDDLTYYFVATKDPENKAIDSLLDRAYGKPKESVAVKHTGLSLKELYDASKDDNDE